MTADLVGPESAAGFDRAPLADAQVASWRHSGFVLVDGLLPEELVAEVVDLGRGRFPEPDSPGADDFRHFGSALVFPAAESAFDRATLHPRLLAAVGQLLDQPVSDLRLTQSTLWPKYGRAPDGPERGGNDDQRIHVDYPNHMLVHPTPWDRPAAVEVIVYYSDHGHSGGSTAVVPRQGPEDPLYPWPIVGSPGIGPLPWIDARSEAEDYLADHRPELASFRSQLYRREVHTRFRPGTVLLYRHDTWHRGTPLLPGARRLAQNLTFRRADATWIETLHRGWSWSMYRPDQYVERFVAELSVDQRSVLGVPPPGHPYWCPATVEAMTARYGAFGFDPTPYTAALDR
ncbi:MAG: hypothetical protein AAFO29_03580 [Actinomycetota bacterium]